MPVARPRGARPANATSDFRIEPSGPVLAAARGWLADARKALGADFLSGAVVGSGLTQGFHPRRSPLDVLLVARRLEADAIDRIARIPVRRPGGIRVAPLLHTRARLERSADVFAIELADLKERHLQLEGPDLLVALDIPRQAIRLQCERELRTRVTQLTQAYLRERASARALGARLVEAGVGLVPLCRSLLRLRGEIVPAHGAHVLEKVADVYELDAESFLWPYAARYRAPAKSAGAPALRRRTLAFLTQLDRLAIATDRLPIA